MLVLKGMGLYAGFNTTVLQYFTSFNNRPQIMTGCRYVMFLPLHTYQVNGDFENGLLFPYTIENTIFLFAILDGSIPSNDDKNNSLAANRWELRVYTKNDDVISYKINNILLKTSQFTKNIEEFSYIDDNYYIPLKDEIAGYYYNNIQDLISHLSFFFVHHTVYADNDVGGFDVKDADA